MADEEDKEVREAKSDDKGYTLAGMAEAFNILARYGDKKFDYCAEHDEIYAGAEIEAKVSKADRIRLAELGWHKCSEGGFRKNA